MGTMGTIGTIDTTDIDRITTNQMPTSDLGAQIIRYSPRIPYAYLRRKISVERKTYIYDPALDRFYQTESIVPSTFSYHGATTLLSNVSNANTHSYVLVPVYSSNLFFGSKLFGKPRNSLKMMARPTLKASINNPRWCNLGDIQATFGGKLKVGETFMEGMIRELREESCIELAANAITYFSENTFRGNICRCYSASIDKLFEKHEFAGEFADEITNDSTDDSAQSTEIESETKTSSNIDDKNKKVCISVYGSLDNMIKIVKTIQDSKKTPNDNIIALGIVPIEEAIRINRAKTQDWDIDADANSVFI